MLYEYVRRDLKKFQSKIAYVQDKAYTVDTDEPLRKSVSIDD